MSKPPKAEQPSNTETLRAAAHAMSAALVISREHAVAFTKVMRQVVELLVSTGRKFDAGDRDGALSDLVMAHHTEREIRRVTPCVSEEFAAKLGLAEAVATRSKLWTESRHAEQCNNLEEETREIMAEHEAAAVAVLVVQEDGAVLATYQAGASFPFERLAEKLEGFTQAIREVETLRDDDGSGPN